MTKANETASPTGDGASLLAYCHQHPDDDQARLVYADWLEEQGDQPQAEFIRLQLRRAALWEGHPDADALSQRERELLEAHRDRWTQQLPRSSRKKFGFVRGLPTHLDVTAEQYLKRGP